MNGVRSPAFTDFRDARHVVFQVKINTTMSARMSDTLNPICAETTEMIRKSRVTENRLSLLLNHTVYQCTNSHSKRITFNIMSKSGIDACRRYDTRSLVTGQAEVWSRGWQTGPWTPDGPLLLSPYLQSWAIARKPPQFG